MVPIKKDLVIPQGSTFVTAFLIEDAPGFARDLTGYTARMMIRADYDDDTELLSATTESSGTKIEIDGIHGMLTLTIQPIDTTNIEFEGKSLKAVYDIEVQYVDDQSQTIVRRILEGNAIITREATR